MACSQYKFVGRMAGAFLRIPLTNGAIDLYHLSFPNDALNPKILVYSVFVIDTSQTILLTYDVFNTFAIKFGNLQELNFVKNEWVSIPLLSGLGKSTLTVSGAL